MISYWEREIEIQINIDHLLSVHPYPLSFYEKMTDKEIKGIYGDYLKKISKKSRKLENKGLE